MKDRLHGSAKGAINAFTTGYSKKGNYSLNSENCDNQCIGI